MKRVYSVTAIVTVRAAWSALTAGPAVASSYEQHNLVSDLPGVADNQDPNLVNPWGISSSATSPMWVSDNGAGVSTLYNGSGQPFPVGNPLVVTIPVPSGGTPPSAPTGQVFNATTDFNVAPGAPARFIFATEDGTIAAWNAGTAAVLQVDNSAKGAVYKGLAIGNNGSSNLLYAANFSAGSIDVFGPNFAQVNLPNAFTDPNLPAGYAPFNIQNIGGKLVVTYAQQDAAKHDDVAGAGHGFVDVYDTNGKLVARLVSQGPLNSPWGVTVAPADFGSFSNDLLVGNFGDGRINVFDPTTGKFLGTLEDANGKPIVNEGLWGLRVGNGANGLDVNSVYFTAGIPGNGQIEDHGLFGSINRVPEPVTLLLLGVGMFALAITRKITAA